MLKLMGRTSSSNVQKVQWCCVELGLSYEHEDVGHGKRNRDPDYLALNPNGLVPTLIDDGFVLWESNTIIYFLASKYGFGTLYPGDSKIQALVSQWMDWTNTVAIPTRRGLHRSINVVSPEKPNQKVIEEARQTFAKTMQILNEQLSKSQYLTGDAFTVGDMPPGVVTHQWYGFDVDHGNMPHLKRWYKLLAKRPGFKTHVMGENV